VWVALLIVAAAAGVVVGQQCARRPLTLLPALGKLTISAVAAAAAMALLGYAGGGELGNFGHLGVDQATFGPAVFLWFLGIGGLTVAMAGGIARRPRAARVSPDVGADPDEPEPGDELEEEPEEPQEPEEAEEQQSDEDEPASVEEEPMPVIRLPLVEADVPDLDELPDPEDLAYIDDDDATPGPIGDQRRPADD
jgi:hypothetical protein